MTIDNDPFLHVAIVNVNSSDLQTSINGKKKIKGEQKNVHPRNKIKECGIPHNTIYGVKNKANESFMT